MGGSNKWKHTTYPCGFLCETPCFRVLSKCCCRFPQRRGTFAEALGQGSKAPIPGTVGLRVAIAIVTYPETGTGNLREWAPGTNVALFTHSHRDCGEKVLFFGRGKHTHKSAPQMKMRITLGPGMNNHAVNYYMWRIV